MLGNIIVRRKNDIYFRNFVLIYVTVVLLFNVAVPCLDIYCYIQEKTFLFVFDPFGYMCYIKYNMIK